MHLRPYACDVGCTIVIMGDLNTDLIARTGYDNRALQVMIDDLGLASCADARWPASSCVFKTHKGDEARGDAFGEGPCFARAARNHARSSARKRPGLFLSFQSHGMQHRQRGCTPSCRLPSFPARCACETDFLLSPICGRVVIVSVFVCFLLLGRCEGRPSFERETPGRPSFCLWVSELRARSVYDRRGGSARRTAIRDGVLQPSLTKVLSD